MDIKRSLGVRPISEPRGQTDLEFLVEKILNRSDPKDTDPKDTQTPRTRSDPKDTDEPGPQGHG